LVLLAVAGCGGAGAATHTKAQGVGATSLAVASSSCTGVTGTPGAGANTHTSSACTFVLSDGRRYGCPARFARGPAQVSVIEHAKACRPLARLVISASLRSVGARMGRVRTCLVAHGLTVGGGLVLPSQGHGAPAGELDTAAALIAFYANLGQASRAEPAVVRNTKRAGGEAERAGLSNIAWFAPPQRQTGDIVRSCVVG
jgi:hypothetical protein